MPASNPNSRIGIKVIIAALVLGAVAFFITRNSGPKAFVETVISADAVDARPGSLTVIPEYSMELKSAEGGRLSTLDFKLKPGAEVKAGEVLARLDPQDLLLEIEKDTNDYQAAKDRLEKDHTGELELQSAFAVLENYRRLNKIGSYPAADLAAQERSYASLQQKVELKRIESNHEIDNDESALKLAKHRLEKMTIAATFDAVVATVYKHPGDLIAPAEAVASLITKNKIVEGKISEQDFAKVKVGDEATVTFIPYGSFEFTGKVVQILPTADPETQRHVVYMDVTTDASQPLVPGINGEMSIIVDKHNAKAVIPRRALFSHNGDSVWVVKNGVVEERHVKRGFVWASGVEITEGLEPGELVIVDELEKFHDTDKVSIKLMPSDALKERK
jgi:RND family efflux transporter MFP subunit